MTSPVRPLSLLCGLLVSCAAWVHPGKAETPSLWLIGDSTVRNGQGQMVGWGEEIGKYFDASKITVKNQAIGGRSSRTFRNEGRWEKVAAELKPGDLVFIQFGHNDVGAVDERGKFRGSLKGIGDDVESVQKPDGTTEEVHSYGWYLKQFSQEAKEKGATVVIFSPVPHKDWDGKKLKSDFVDHRTWAEQAAKATGASFVDLTAIVSKGYEKLGPAKVEELFADPRTHTSKAGADYNARCVIIGLDGLPGKPLAKFLSPEGSKVKP